MKMKKSQLTRATEEAGADHMPPLRHKCCDPYDVTRSEVAKWLCSRPEVMEAVFVNARKHGLIAYDPATGLWEGTGRPPQR